MGDLARREPLHDQIENLGHHVLAELVFGARGRVQHEPDRLGPGHFGACGRKRGGRPRTCGIGQNAPALDRIRVCQAMLWKGRSRRHRCPRLRRIRIGRYHQRSPVPDRGGQGAQANAGGQTILTCPRS